MAELAWDNDPDVSTRIGKAISPRLEALFDAANHGEPFELEHLLTEVGGHLDGDRCAAALLDLWFVDPFAPYEISVSRSVRNGSLNRVAAHTELEP